MQPGRLLAKLILIQWAALRLSEQLSLMLQIGAGCSLQPLERLIVLFKTAVTILSALTNRQKHQLLLLKKLYL